VWKGKLCGKCEEIIQRGVSYFPCRRDENESEPSDEVSRTLSPKKNEKKTKQKREKR
jgi:hypothetical protein